MLGKRPLTPSERVKRHISEAAAITPRVVLDASLASKWGDLLKSRGGTYTSLIRSLIAEAWQREFAPLESAQILKELRKLV
jgi:hypothetical protein